MEFLLMLYLFNILRTYTNLYVKFNTSIYKIRINYVLGLKLNLLFINKCS